MKKIVLFILLIFSLLECSSLLNGQRPDINSKQYKANQPNLYLSKLDDSIFDIFEGKEFLFFRDGHDGYNWSLAVPEKNYYVIVSGNSRSNDFLTDTVCLNVSSLKWGFDTMAINRLNMKPVPKDYYFPFYSRLVLFSPKKEILFDCNDINKYSGPDSATFNNKLGKLEYLMLWFASPIILRGKLPSPLKIS